MDRREIEKKKQAVLEANRRNLQMQEYQKNKGALSLDPMEMARKYNKVKKVNNFVQNQVNNGNAAKFVDTTKKVLNNPKTVFDPSTLMQKGTGKSLFDPSTLTNNPVAKNVKNIPQNIGRNISNAPKAMKAVGNTVGNAGKQFASNVANEGFKKASTEGVKQIGTSVGKKFAGSAIGKAIAAKTGGAAAASGLGAAGLGAGTAAGTGAAAGTAATAGTAAGAGGAAAGTGALAAAGPVGAAIAGALIIGSAIKGMKDKKTFKEMAATENANNQFMQQAVGNKEAAMQNIANQNGSDLSNAINDYANEGQPYEQPNESWFDSMISKVKGDNAIQQPIEAPQEEGSFLGKLGEGLGDFALGYKENRDTPFSFDNWKDGADQVQSFKNSINPEDYRTALTPEETESFNTWVDGMRSKGAINPNDQFQDYDMQGYWKNEVLGNTGLANGNAQDHFTDKYKMPNHETFSNESQYYNDDNAKYAGSWNGDQFNAPDVEKSKMMRLGEIMGSAARFANKPAIQGLIAGGLKAANTGNIGDGVEYGMGWAQNKASSDYYAKMLGENPTLLGTLDKDVVKTAIEQQYKNAMMNNMANRNQNDALKTQAYLANVQNQMTNRDRTANLNERKFNYTKQNGSGKNDDFAIRKLIFENQLKALDSSMMNDTEKSLAREQLYNDYNSYLATRGTLMNKGIDPSRASLANIAPNSEEALAQPPKADSIIGDYILMQEDPDFYNSLLNG